MSSAPIARSDSKLSPHWSRGKLIAFRFAFAIAALSTLRVSIFLPPHFYFNVLKQPTAALLGRWEELEWQATSAIGALMIRTVTGGHSTMHDLLMKFRANRTLSALPDIVGLLTVALLIAILWTVFDKHRANYCLLDRFLRVYLRYALGGVMLTYAFIKVIPTQFGFLSPGELLRPLGQLSRFDLLWDFMAASQAYTVFTGFAELTGAVLLFFRRTTLLGGLILAGALTNVVMMDLAYGVGAVTYATLLLLLDVILLAPYLPALGDVLLLGGKTSLPSEPLPTRRRWYYAPAAKVALLCVLALPLVIINIERRRSFFGARQPVYGLFDVTAFVRDGQTITPLASDSATWKRVATWSVASGGPFFISIQFADGDVRPWSLRDDADGRVWTITQPNSSPIATLHYAVLQDRDVALDGKLGNDSVHMLLHPVDMQEFFPLLRR